MGQEVRLSDFRGRVVVLVFYPKDNSAVCSMQLREYATSHGEFLTRDAALLAISRDNAEAHTRFIDDCGLPFPLLVDADGSVCRQYGALGLFGMPKRAVVIIGRDGIILFTHVTLPVNWLRVRRILEEIDRHDRRDHL